MPRLRRPHSFPANRCRGRCSPLNVDPELLAAFALECRTRCENLLGGHPGGAVETAIAGWIGDSRRALAETAQRWAESAARGAARIEGSGEALRAAAGAATGMEEAHRRELLEPS